MTSEQNENVTPSPEEQESTAPRTDEAAAEGTAEPATPAPAADDAEETSAAESAEFAEMLDASGEADPAEAKPGDKLTGTIVQIEGNHAFVDCGLRNELPIDVEELKDEDGQLRYEVGQKVTGHVQKSNDGLKLTMALDLRQAGMKVLEDAFAAGTPVEGKVGDTNKGGFSIDLGGKRAFCPFSQIDLRRVEDPTVFVGKTLKFKILELSQGGKNIVVSRRALLDEERRSQGEETRQTLKLGDVREGTVTRLVPFGAFVDIGGVEGLVHISQISHQRVGNPAEVLKEGQNVKVKVLEIQNLGQGRSERISLSIKALASDPWPTTASSLAPGSDVEGRVTRLVDFGVFMELQPGVEGLVHISELANKRIIHPREVLNEDEIITVRILDIDLDRRRISLSRRQAADYDGD